MFCDIFNQEKNVDKFEKFVSIYFDIEYEKVHNNLQLIPRKLPKNKKMEAWKEVDLLLKLDNELLKINIEINDKNEQNKMDRNLIYLCKISGDSYKQGDIQYKNIYTTRQINFNVFDYKNNKLINEYYLMNKEENLIFSKKMQIDAINVAMVDKICYNSLNKKEQLVYNFIKMLMTEDEKEFKKVSELIMEKEQANDLLDQVIEKSNDDEYVYMESTYSSQEEYNEAMAEIIREESTQQGLEQGLKQGIEQGIKEEKIEIAKNMLNLNIDLDLISKSTGLSKEEITKIQAES